MIPLKDQETLKQRFTRDLASMVRIDYFAQKPSPIFIAGRQDCVTCEDVRRLLEELAHLSPRISLTQHDLDAEPEIARSLGVELVPGVVVRGRLNRPLRFFGSPAGRQFPAFIETLILASRTEALLKPETIKALTRLKTDVAIRVLVTPACPFSPAVALTAVRFALHSVRVKAEVVAVTEFPTLVQRYAVPAVPLTIFNERFAVPGGLDEASLARNILLVTEGKQPGGGDPRALTPFPAPQTQQQQQPRVSPGGLVIPR
jgi:glutaredoxin-like protein